MTDSDEKPAGLTEALEIARGGAGPLNDEGPLKVIGFLLGKGECDAWISAEGIAVRDKQESLPDDLVYDVQG